MENQHKKFKGYRDLSQEEIDLINEIKGLGPRIEEVVNKIRQLKVQYDPYDPDAEEGSQIEVDQRWVSIAVTHLQQGLMALTRSVAKPNFF